MIFKYDDFILENMINESRLYYSPKVRTILNKMNDPIAKDLVALETTDLPIDVTFVDLDENKEGYLTFTTMKSAEKYLLPLGQGTVDFFKGTSSNPDFEYKPDAAKKSSDAMAVDKHEPYIKSRNPVRLGKFVNNLLPNKYDTKERELFVNRFKSTLDQVGERFILVEGEDINHYYWHENYKQGGGSLNSSCMRDEKGIFELYVDNPEVCRLLVLLEDELVIGRSLIWKLSDITDIDVDYFMDRQYIVKQSDVEKFRAYADKEGWAYKDENRHSSFSGVVYNNVVYSVSMEVQVKRKNYEYFPYMDTFRSFEHNDCILVNSSIDDDSDYYLLDGTSGEYTDGSRVYSEYSQDWIDRDDAIWSEPLDTYISDYNSVEVRRASNWRNKGSWPVGHEDLVYDEWNDEEIMAEDSVYSDEYEHYLYDDDAVSVINKLDEAGDANEDSHFMHEDDTSIIKISDLEDSYWYKQFMIETEENDNENYWDNHKYIKRELLSKDYKGEWVPDVFLVDIYKIDKNLNLFNSNKITDDFVEKFKNIDMLSEIDARAFEFNGINDDEDKKERVSTSEFMDKWTYRDYIKPIRDLLMEELKSKIEEAMNEKNPKLANEYKRRLEELKMYEYEEEQKAED